MSENRARGFNRRTFLKGTAAARDSCRASLGTAISGRLDGTGGGRGAGPHPTPRRRVARHGPGHPEPHDRGSLRVHVQEPAAAPGPGDAARRPGCRPWRNSPPRHHATSMAVVTPPRTHNDAFNENPNPTSSRRGSPSSASSSTTTSPSTPRSSIEQQSDPDATTNFRTPRYDLDAIYGLGPSTNPQFYDPSDRDKFLIDETSLQHRSPAEAHEAGRRARNKDLGREARRRLGRASRRQRPRRRPRERPSSPTPATTRR